MNGRATTAAKADGHLQRRQFTVHVLCVSRFRFIAVFAVISIDSTIVEIRVDARPETRQYISMDIEKAASQLESLGNPTRLRIYRILVRAGVDGLAVGGLQQKVEIPASTLSHHCRKLIEAGLVTQERMGTTLICRANYKVMTSLIGYLSDECCSDGRSFSGAESERA